MRKINDPEKIRRWEYFDKRLGVGFVGTRDQVTLQTQQAFMRNRIEFHEHEIPALIEDHMCRNGLATNCSERLTGLGDLVYVAIKMFDKVVGTGYSSTPCAGCTQRREDWNKKVPL